MSQPLSRLIEGLRHALMSQWPAGADWAQLLFEPLKAKGLAHDHVRLVGTGWLARIPKQSQMRLSATDNLVYQQACFSRASPAGHAPSCLRLIQACDALPRGALIVEEISGRAAHLPQDLPLMAASMAAMHRIALPPEQQAAPLLYAPDPLQAMWDEIQAQAAYLPRAELAGAVSVQIQLELEQFQALCQRSARPLRRLIAFDGHPGNFVIGQAAGKERAYLVDLEKCRYSYPGFDLAHATLYTSTTWDTDSTTVLSVDDVLSAYGAWGTQVDSTLAQDAQRWHLPLRRAMWLWSVTWCAKWRVASRAAAASGGDGEDWSAQNIEATLAAHVRERVDHYLSAGGIAIVRSEFDALARSFSSLA
jgi:hypothetical protein